MFGKTEVKILSKPWLLDTSLPQILVSLGIIYQMEKTFLNNWK